MGEIISGSTGWGEEWCFLMIDALHVVMVMAVIMFGTNEMENETEDLHGEKGAWDG